MINVRKMIRAHDGQITRFHTQRGELCSLNSFLRIPKAIWDRFSGRYKYSPWIVPEAVSWLEREICENWRVFEFGSGWSTIWYAQHCKDIVSVESDEDWHQVVNRRVNELSVNNCVLRLSNLGEFPSTIMEFPDDYFHLVVVDSSEDSQNSRFDVLKASMSKVRPGGFILFDDSDRPKYSTLPDYLNGWKLRKFVGLKPRPLMAVETSIFQRPGARGN